MFSPNVLLPGSGTADHWLDFLQSLRNFWSSLTTRYASLAPLSDAALRRERRRVQAKHLWDQVSLDWQALDRKLFVVQTHWTQVVKPFGGCFLWPDIERIHGKSRNTEDTIGETCGLPGRVHNLPWGSTRLISPPFPLTFRLSFEALKSKMKVLRSAKDQHACRWQTKEGTYRVKRRSLPDVRDTGGDVSMGDL